MTGSVWISYPRPENIRASLLMRRLMSTRRWMTFWKQRRKRVNRPFIFLLDNIEDPHNLGAIIRTANLAGAHGVIIPKNRAAGLTATVARTSAGALNYTPVAKVTNLAKTIEDLKRKVCGSCVRIWAVLPCTIWI